VGDARYDIDSLPLRAQKMLPQAMQITANVGEMT